MCKRTQSLSSLEYAVNLEEPIAHIQIKILEKIIETKFSPNHARIFRLLKSFEFLEEKQVFFFFFPFPFFHFASLFCGIKKK